MHLKNLLMGVGLAALSTAAVADTTITLQNTFSGNTSTDHVYIKGGMIRADSGQGQGYMIFDSAQGTVTTVQPEQQQYTVMTKEDLKAMGSAVQNAMKQMEAQLANLPPAQREQVRAMMKQRLGAMMDSQGQAPKTEIVQTGQSKTVGGYGCSVVNIMVDGEQTGSACMAQWDELDIASADRQTIESMLDFSREMMKQFGGMMPTHLAAMTQDGYPVQWENRSGNTTISGELKSVQGGSVSADLFQVPSGYTRRSLPTMPGG